jgi:hypothetical protein
VEGVSLVFNPPEEDVGIAESGLEAFDWDSSLVERKFVSELSPFCVEK